MNKCQQVSSLTADFLEQMKSVYDMRKMQLGMQPDARFKRQHLQSANPRTIANRTFVGVTDAQSSGDGYLQPRH
jgi:hypothetical protein